MSQDPSKIGHVFEEGLTDDQIAGLDAIEKVSYIKSLVAQAVAQYEGQPQLSDEEVKLVMDYRAWKEQRGRAGDIFHWRKPSRKDK